MAQPKKDKAEALRATPGGSSSPQPRPTSDPDPEPEPGPGPSPKPTPGDQKIALRLVGTVPPEVWNRLGTKVLPKLRSFDNLSVGIEFSVSVSSMVAQQMEAELRQILDDLSLADRVRVEKKEFRS